MADLTFLLCGVHNTEWLWLKKKNMELVLKYKMKNIKNNEIKYNG